MRFYITNQNNQVHEIHENIYSDLRKTKEFLSKILSSERVFDMLVENYIDLEREILNQVLSHSFNPYEDSLSKPIYEINRRIINFLTTCRLFSEHSCRLFSGNSEGEACAIYKKDSEKAKRFRERFSEQAKTQEFRMVSALRNYAQHTDIPFQYLTVSSSRVEAGSDFFLKYTISPKIDVKELLYKFDSLSNKEKSKADCETLNELRDQIDYIEIIPLLRKTMDSMGLINLEIRSLIEDDWISFRNVMCDFFEKYKASSYMILRDECNKAKEISIVPKVLTSDRLRLVEKNKDCTGYSRRFVSSESPRH